MSSPLPDEGWGPSVRRLVDTIEYRPQCYSCHRPRAFCYCPLIQTFDSNIRIVIPTHPREAKHAFRTGRMAHLCVRNSVLIEGINFYGDDRVDRELRDLGRFPVLLFPGKHAINLSRQSQEQRRGWVPDGLQLSVFVLDGTRRSARNMLRLSQNLASLPMICFEPPSPSRYRIRRQPKTHCYSTLEAIHQVLDLFTPGGSNRPDHDNLLKVFASVIDRQLDCQTSSVALSIPA